MTESYSMKEVKVKRVLLAVVMVIVLVKECGGCGPGRGVGRRRGPRKLTPLVFKQHVPNLSENTLGASGAAEGRITRQDARFSELVSNYNPDIIFKDEEGSSSDRLMTQRCKDKLNTLAISVMNQWEGVKLRVTEAWDEEGTHARDSLHYEGRAVDVTTSDLDRSKYGMLARLAVEAGFDWVFYESRGHVHCSVKSDSSIAVKTGGCFPGTSHVTVEGRGRVPLTSVKVGERVLASDSEGHVAYSDVMLFLHHNATAIGSFYSLQADSGHVIQLTANHLIYRSRCRTNHTTDNFVSCAEAVFADDVRVGDTLFHVASDKKYVMTSRVVSITVERIAGMYAPLTSAGNVIVDDVIVSCYATVGSQSVAHASFAPLRLWRAARALLTGDQGQGVPTSSEDSDWYVHLLSKVGQLLLPSGIWFGSKPLV